MMRATKRQKEVSKLVDKDKKYTLSEAISVLKSVPHPKFDETVTISFKVNIDQKEAPQSVRSTVALPHGTGKKVRVAVFCKGESVIEARNAGADFIGANDLIDKIAAGWSDFDVAVSTPEMMKDLSKLGKILGPRGLMPNPKAGTVTQDVAKAIKEVKAGKIEFRMDKQSNIHTPVGKLSFAEGAINDNASVLIESVIKNKPATVKGHFIKSISIASSMGPGLKLDIAQFSHI
ncbi:MAG: 50S ribosomal protein L1 [Candidatus Omnitrophica bacterium CG12_big_fil_rev_8_21_14_0_65_43_15]|uniref:Large ribosomal subunit protein uL1 n=1 Tax=Candidatus Taenaricola geysiri TaxID=1974752 RepID=A0A2J0LG88_9BACT|nr:MAG: 50S ribosomal protein L1 [Candidatus Omnitrophica bacterium CG10_big_fil_rev_8_21_14_0_10_43_8]PIV11780.1 MAG: 50S ribosomal protein L1 [Candidatus Omnitrophica bacterium CG03_land_8_20_14_0_80_43_22]PIW65874.1 MAG: 50S ribosomal protein L1 [Candidatus Omnitrophica bacterium CG12_big_fil_rev_8_21_14_0_65_43_15]PIW80185.1 MAG: 50S ribosomal protein L1 [Candidatus Omnitrophica bacterium CG_4_8_14_3_um_filter_43_15]PIY84713.1 MAG: 50S ribosomal protein L1 [Candidatus Omnitrophica bacterium